MQHYNTPPVGLAYTSPSKLVSYPPNTRTKKKYPDALPDAQMQVQVLLVPNLSVHQRVPARRSSSCHRSTARCMGRERTPGTREACPGTSEGRSRPPPLLLSLRTPGSASGVVVVVAWCHGAVASWCRGVVVEGKAYGLSGFSPTNQILKTFYSN